MQIQSVESDAFKPYGKIIEGIDFSQLLDVLEKTTEKPADGVIYVPGDQGLESLPVCEQLRDNVFGGMPIQVGYCNGTNSKLNCLEYHRDCEINVAADDVVILLAKMDELDGDYTLDTSKVQAFSLPKGMAVQLYETTLHYAPSRPEGGFRVVIVLPRGTNTDKPAIQAKNKEDRLLWGRNKWLIAHRDTDEAKQGAFVGLVGENIDLAK